LTLVGERAAAATAAQMQLSVRREVGLGLNLVGDRASVAAAIAIAGALDDDAAATRVSRSFEKRLRASGDGGFRNPWRW
jgi:hypothetical protein